MSTRWEEWLEEAWQSGIKGEPGMLQQPGVQSPSLAQAGASRDYPPVLCAGPSV